MYDQISSNKWKSLAMVVVFVLFVLGVGFIIGAAWGGTDSWYIGLGIAFAIALIMSLVSYYKSDKIALRISGARPLADGEFPRYRNTVEGLAVAAGLPTPAIYVIQSPALNAFATGRNPENSAVAVTTGLLEALNNQELEGVVAHEMSHIKNYDILLQTITIVLVGTIIMLSDLFLRTFWFRDRDSGDSGQAGLILAVIGIVLAILAPIIAQMIKLAISRKREFLADANGALLTRYPPGLASALARLRDDTQPLRTANKATAHLYIVQPLRPSRSEKKRSGLFDTHPPIEERIRRLEQMSGDFVPGQPGQVAWE